MTSCPCAPDALTSVRFDGGVVMLRCGAHDQQRWLLDGRPTPREEVLPVLKDVFTERRGQRRRAHTVPGPVKVVRMTAPAYDEVPVGAVDGERLTALLRARGLTGSWAVA